MARKRSGGKIKAKLDDKTASDLMKVRIKPLMQQETMFFKELVDSSNDYAKLMQQKAQYELIVKNLEKNRKKIQQNKIKPPFLMALIPKLLYYQEPNKKEILKIYDEQIDMYNKNIKTLNGQIEHRYENFVESSVRNREFMSRRFANAKAKAIVGARKDAIKEEEALFEAEFAELAKDPKVKEKFDKAKREAIKLNTARKTKKTNVKVKA